MQPRLPKIAATVVERQRITAWLTTHAHVAVRYLIAPAGSGKTTAAVHYARRSERCAYVTVPSGCGESDLIAAIADALAIANITSYPQLIGELARRAPFEIIVDHCDRAAAEGIAMLERLFGDVPDGIAFMYLARNAEAMPLRYARAQGLVEVAGGKLLAFDCAEAAALAQTCGVDATADELARFIDATHGWAFAVAGAVRTARSSAKRLDDAVRSWRRENEETLAELVATARRDVAPATAKRFDHVIAGHIVPDDALLEALERAGLFVTRVAGRYAVNPLVRPQTESPDGRALPAVIEMFGRFEMTIGGRPVVWIRRRDRQIVQYLATAPHARATRAELMSVFWPDADRHSAGQSLRSACSTIRRAIGACAGSDRVERYFIGTRTLELVLDNVMISTQRFTALYATGQAAASCGNVSEAFMAFRSAEMLYRAPFLSGEEPLEWSRPYERRFAEMADAISESLEALGRRLDAHETDGSAYTLAGAIA